MPEAQDVKEMAYTIDPACWISYSGKPRAFKAAMDARRTASIGRARVECARIASRMPRLPTMEERLDAIEERLSRLEREQGR